MVWQMAPDEKSTGVYTGLYYAASFSSQIIGPLTFGFIFEYGIGLRYLLLILSCLIILAFIFMSRVKRGEFTLSDEERERRKQLAESQDD
jgi:MFS family permease